MFFFQVEPLLTLSFFQAFDLELRLDDYSKTNPNLRKALTHQDYKEALVKVKIYNSQTKQELQFDLGAAIRSSGKCTVGRSPTSGLILESSHVSHTHGIFIYQAGSYYFADTGSSNGSLLNNNVTLKNQTYLLKAGDVLQIGNFVLTPQPVVKDYEDATVLASINLQSPPITFNDELLAVATGSEKVPVAADAEPAVVSAMPEEVVERAEEISAAVAEQNASAETLVTTEDVSEQKVAEVSVPEESVNAGIEQKVPRDNTQSCVQLSQVNQQIKRVSPLTFSQKFYQTYGLEIAEEFEQAIEANSLEKMKDLLDKILELDEGK